MDGIDNSICVGSGHRTKIRTCDNGCDDVLNKNLTIIEECEVTEDGFQI